MTPATAAATTYTSTFSVVSANTRHPWSRKYPAATRTEFQMAAPIVEYTTKFRKRILPIPAGKEMNDRVPGSAWPRRIPRSPHFANHASAHARSEASRAMNRPYRSISGRPALFPMPYATAFPTAAPTVPTAIATTRFIWPVAERYPAKGMMNSLGIGVMIPSRTISPKIAPYPPDAITEAIQSVRPRNREGTRAEPGAPPSRFGRRDHPPDSLRDELSLLGDEFAADERRGRERRLHPLERRPPAFVTAPLRGDLLDPPRVHDEEVRVPADRDLPLVGAEEAGRVRGEHRHKPVEREHLAADVAEQERERRRDPWDSGGRLVERERLLLQCMGRVVAQGLRFPRPESRWVLGVGGDERARVGRRAEDPRKVGVPVDGLRVRGFCKVHLERGRPFHGGNICTRRGCPVQSEVDVRVPGHEPQFFPEDISARH